jgi:hypothetical protein
MIDSAIIAASAIAKVAFDEFMKFDAEPQSLAQFT